MFPSAANAGLVGGSGGSGYQDVVDGTGTGTGDTQEDDDDGCTVTVKYERPGQPAGSDGGYRYLWW